MISVSQLLQILDMNLEKYIIFSLSHLKGRYSKLMKASKIILCPSQSHFNTPDCKNWNGAKRLKILSTSGFTNSSTEIMLESKFTLKFSCVILTKLTILSTMAYYCLFPLREKILLYTSLVRGRWYFIMSSSQSRLGKWTHHRSVLKKNVIGMEALKKSYLYK